ncbi:FMN-binding protein [Asanoa sp. NPDC049518]|uniref:FMN-binding protein n=1 Tax=unclassified Asanoa TaxID=2685164 RepID=UPI003435F2A7
MRRAVLAVAGLAAGTSLLVVVKGGAGAAPDTVAAANAGPTPSPSAAGAPDAADPSAPASKAPDAKKTTTAKPKSGRKNTAAAPPPAAPKSNKVVGPRVENPYGAVQVVLELDGNRIVNVRTLEMPDQEARSDQLSAQVESQLGDEAVREQGADLDTVSGATETSESYKESLRVAIDRMKKGERD